MAYGKLALVIIAVAIATLAQLEVDEDPLVVERHVTIPRTKSEVFDYVANIEKMTEVERMRKVVPLDNPSKAKKALELDSMTVETFKRQHLTSNAAREAINAAVRVMFGMECCEMSVLYFLHYANSAGGLTALIEASEGAGQEFKIKGGAQPLSEKLADKIGRENVWLNEPVVQVNQEDRSKVVITTASGKTVSAKRVIMSVPPNFVVKIDFCPSLPLDKRSLLQRQPMGHLIKFIATYSNKFWRENGQSGEVVCSYGDPVLAHDSGPLCLVYDATSPNGNPALVGFLGKSREWSKRSSEERKKAVLDHLMQFFGEMAGTPIDYVEKVKYYHISVM
uniref:monoamine oxidase n=1 Tax=Saccoglossus kowalevskii TaxID=10224 RepID=A0ABM0MBE6_SACKO|nr:PREDICTED: probable flavin-containing monoamine oxidase A-like [Saccoglossus kowalevskii]